MNSLTPAQEERALLLHRESLIVNTHSDNSFDVVEQRSKGDRGVMARKHLPRLRDAGITLSVETVGGDSTCRYTFPRNHSEQIHSHPSPLRRALQTLDAMTEEMAEASESTLLALNAADVERAYAEGKIAQLFALEGGQPVEDDLALLRTFYRLGVRMFGLTWNRRNQLGDGARARGGGGLSDLGVEFVREAARIGMLVDVSHLNGRGTMDVAAHCDGPFMASHSNARALTSGYGDRNLTDEAIRAIAEHEGYIGVAALSLLITGRLDSTLDNLLDHVDYIRQLVGVDYVGLGLDLLEDWPQEDYESIWGEWTELTFPEGLSSVRQLPSFTRGLVARGYTDDEIRKILGGNFLRVLRSVAGPKGGGPEADHVPALARAR